MAFEHLERYSKTIHQFHILIFLCKFHVMKLLSLLFLFLPTTLLAKPSAWTQKANFGGTARHRCASFAIGNKGYVSLGHINSGPLGNILYSDFWEYDPASNSWCQKADFGGGLRYHTISFKIGSKAYVGTGRNEFSAYERDLWEFDPIANTWTAKADFPGQVRRGAISFVIDNIGYVGTGQVYSTGSNEFYAYDRSTDSWTAKADFPEAERNSACAFAIGDTGYVGTGNVWGGTTDFYAYIPATDTWIPRANVGTIPRQEGCGFSVRGKGYIGTGDNYSSGTNYGDFWEYDPASDTWIQIEDFGGTACRYLVSFVIKDHAYCGVGTNGINFRDLWVFDQTLSLNNATRDYLDVNFYPNPAIEHTNIVVESITENVDIENLRIQVYNIAGALISDKKIQSNIEQINRPASGSGLYVYHISLNNRILEKGKIIFQ